MTLDFVLFRPEFFLVFGFFVLLWYGTGNLVTPVAEILTVTNLSLSANNKEMSSYSKRIKNKQKSTNFRRMQTRGPNHAASALTQWAIVWLFLSLYCTRTSPLHLVFQRGSFQKDEYSLGLCNIQLITAIFVQRVSYGWQKVAGICHTEYIYLAMQALTGQYLQIMATDLMSLYLCMEQQSFSLVVLCGLNSKSAYSLEAAMKYFLLSAFRSCLLLLGVGFIYWQTGETSISAIEKIVQRTSNNPSLLTALGIWLVSTGLLWKQAAAPLHFWVPDVYMGAWSSVSLWITVQPKIAVLAFWTSHWHIIWSSTFGNRLILFRAASMIVGRIAPLAQTNIKRLLAYSSVGHMGQLLMPLCRTTITNRGTAQSTILGEVKSINFMDTPVDSIGVLWAYMIIYVIINLGAWSMLLWPIYRPLSLFVQRDRENVHSQPRKMTTAIDGTGRGAIRAAPQYQWDLKGLNSSSPRAAQRWAVFITSFAGLPPVYSFQGKAGLIWNRVNNGLFILVFVSQRYTMTGAVYYLKVMKICYVDKQTSWASYGKASPITAYVIRLSVSLMIVGLWHGNFLFLFAHTLALKI